MDLPVEVALKPNVGTKIGKRYEQEVDELKRDVILNNLSTCFLSFSEFLDHIRILEARIWRISAILTSSEEARIEISQNRKMSESGKIRIGRSQDRKKSGEKEVKRGRSQERKKSG